MFVRCLLDRVNGYNWTVISFWRTDQWASSSALQ